MTNYAQQIVTPAAIDTPIPIESDPDFVVNGYIVTDVVGPLTYKIKDDQGNLSEALDIQGPLIWRFQYCNYQALVINPGHTGTTHVVITNVFKYPDIPVQLINQLWPDLIPAGPETGLVTEFDDTEAAVPIPANTRVVLKSYTSGGAAMAVIASDGTGEAQVNMVYAKDGGPDNVITAANVAAIVAVGYTASLTIAAVNTDIAAPHNSSDISQTGLTT